MDIYSYYNELEAAGMIDQILAGTMGVAVLTALVAVIGGFKAGVAIFMIGAFANAAVVISDYEGRPKPREVVLDSIDELHGAKKPSGTTEPSSTKDGAKEKPEIVVANILKQPVPAATGPFYAHLYDRTYFHDCCDFPSKHYEGFQLKRKWYLSIYTVFPHKTDPLVNAMTQEKDFSDGQFTYINALHKGFDQKLPIVLHRVNDVWKGEPIVPGYRLKDILWQATYNSNGAYGTGSYYMSRALAWMDSFGVSGNKGQIAQQEAEWGLMFPIIALVDDEGMIRATWGKTARMVFFDTDLVVNEARIIMERAGSDQLKDANLLANNDAVDVPFLAWNKPYSERIMATYDQAYKKYASFIAKYQGDWSKVMEDNMIGFVIGDERTE